MVDNVDGGLLDWIVEYFLEIIDHALVFAHDVVIFIESCARWTLHL